MWSRFNWLRIGTSGVCCERDIKHFCLRERPLSSQEGLFSVELVCKVALDAYLRKG
jgi:hypothetical protein